MLFLLRFRAGAFVVLSRLVFAMDHSSIKGLTGQHNYVVKGVSKEQAISLLPRSMLGGGPSHHTGESYVTATAHQGARAIRCTCNQGRCVAKIGVLTALG